MRLKLFCAAFFILCVFSFVYHPSLYHTSRADHVNYLADTAGNKGWFDLAIRTYDLNRSRTFGTGDELLFRPVLYFILGTERAFFGYNNFAWQLTSVSVHAVVCVLLFFVLRLFCGPWAALLAASAFAFLLANLEAVIWHHIVGYLFFAGLVLVILRELIRYPHQGNSPYRLWLITSLLTVAVFTYEAGLWYCVCAFIYLYRQAVTDRSRKMAAVVLIPCVLYLTASVSNYLVLSASLGHESSRIIHGIGVYQTLINYLQTIKWHICAGLFLRAEDIIPPYRLAVSPETLGWGWPFDVLKGYYFLGVVLLLAWGSLRLIKRDETPKQTREILLMLGLMMAGYVAILVIGRVNSRGIADGLSNTLYYHYNFWLLLVIWASAAIGFESLRLKEWGQKIGLIAASAVLGLMLNHAGDIYRVNAIMAAMFAEQRGFVMALEDLVRSHSHEPDFSFSVAPGCPGNYRGRMFRNGDSQGQTYSFAEILYPQYYKEQNPKYTLQGK